MNELLLDMNNITKTFGDVIACNKVNFSVKTGEVHAVLGENGAGKSTLMNIISGIYIPDKGQIKFMGSDVRFQSPKDSINKGIAMIHQHFKLVETLSVLDNLLLGQVKNTFINRRKASEYFKKKALEFQIDIDLSASVSEISMGQKQLVEIIKVLSRNPKLIILDEPTTVLTPQEVSNLFNIINNLKQSGISIIFISHKMDEVFEVSDSLTILRKGYSIVTRSIKGLSENEICEYMVGEPIDLNIKKVKTNYTNTILKLDHVSSLNDEGQLGLKNLSLELKAGEILGVAGINGHGQKELCEVISGIRKLTDGKIIFKDEDITKMTVKDILRHGIQMSFVPEDRLGMGLIPKMGIVDNILLKDYYKKGLFLDYTWSKTCAKSIVDELDVKTTSLSSPISLMSGGNIQKVLIGREIKTNPELLITAYPVRGLDINTTLKIYSLLQEQKKKGVGIIYIAEDLDSLLEISDRLLVLHHGKSMGIYAPSTITKEEVGLMMVGSEIIHA